jgi:hypothetical protein
MGQYLFFLLILACPVAMMFMMRGGHGHGGHGHGSGNAEKPSSLEELRRRRRELDDQIAAHDDVQEVDHAHHAKRF